MLHQLFIFFDSELQQEKNQTSMQWMLMHFQKPKGKQQPWLAEILTASSLHNIFQLSMDTCDLVR